MSKVRVSLALLSGLLVHSWVHADPPQTLAEAREQLDQAQREKAGLSAQVAMLQKELADLRAEVAELRSQLAAAQSPAPPAPDTPPVQQTDEQPAPPEPDAKSSPVQTYTSAQDILRNLPPDLKPNARTGWDEFTLPKVRRWLDGAALSAPYDGREIIANVVVGANPTRQFDPSAAEYVVNVHFESRPFNYVGGDLKHNVYALKYYGSEDFARRAKAVKPGSPVRVTGTISGVRTDQDFIPNRKFATVIIQLENAVIHAPALTP